jgi:hypothetical protein
VLRFADRIRTPLPWVRADACMLTILWVFAYAKPGADPAATAGWLLVLMVIRHFLDRIAIAALCRCL